MPLTWNGCGTMYYGKRNPQVRRDACTWCGRPGLLASYDIGYYFVLVFVPILPLGRRRVIDDCGHCHRHGVMLLGKWHRLREASVEEAIRAQAEAPDEPAPTQAALLTAIGFDDESAFLYAAEIAETRHPRDPDVLRALADGYAYLNHNTDAEETYRTLADVAEDDESVRDAMAVTIMRQGRPDDAAPLVDPVFETRNVERVWLARCLVEAYQEQADHAAAHGVLDRCEAVFPGMAKDLCHGFLRKRSIAGQKTGKPAPSRTLRTGTRPPPDEKGKPRRGDARFIVIIAILCVLGIAAARVGTSLVQGQTWKAHVVNGTNAPYRVDVNGTVHSLQPNGRKVVRVAEGEVVIRVLLAVPPIAEQRVVIDTPFLTRSRSDHLFVINPDRVARFVWEQAVYSVTNTSSGDPKFRIHSGQLFYDFKDIDYAFEEFPDSVDGTGSRDEYRKRIDLVTGGAASPADRRGRR